MSWVIERWSTARCAGLRSGFWPATGPARSSCLLLPGLGDFLEKRASTADRLARSGHEVLSLDWCGQGGSGHLAHDLRAAHTTDFEALVDDLVEVVAHRAPPGRPLWCLGYSMGATVALLALRRILIAPAALVLVSPMLRFRLRGPEWPLRLAAASAVRLGIGRSFAPGRCDRMVWESGPSTSPIRNDAR